MSIREEFLKILDYEVICKYLSDDDRKVIIKDFEDKEDLYKKIDISSIEDRIALIIFYNIIIKNDDLKNKKVEEGKKYAFSIKNLSTIVNISEKTFINLNKKFLKELGEDKQVANKKTNNCNKSIPLNILSSIKKYKRNTETMELTKKRLINIFRCNYEYLKLLYPDKTAIKIKEYLAHVQVSLYLAGYEIDNEKLEKLFGCYCKYLNIILTDGRNSRDFVKIKDMYNNLDFKVYIEFQR